MPHITSISVLVKKGIVYKSHNNAQLSYGASADLLPGENWQEECIKLSRAVKTMLTIELPTTEEAKLLQLTEKNGFITKVIL